MKLHVRLRGFAVHALCAAGMLLPPIASPGVANAAIVTNTYSTTSFPSGPSNPDGASNAPGTPALVSIKFDDALTYIGGADSTLRTTVNIPARLGVTIGADFFTADIYYIDYDNAGPGRNSADMSFHTGFFPLSPPSRAAQRPADRRSLPGADAVLLLRREQLHTHGDHAGAVVPASAIRRGGVRPRRQQRQ